MDYSAACSGMQYLTGRDFLRVELPFQRFFANKGLINAFL